MGLSAMLPDVPSCFPAHVIQPDDAVDDIDDPPASPSHVLCFPNFSDTSTLDHLMWSNHTPSCEHKHEDHEHPPVTFDLDDMLPVVENGEPAELVQV